MKIKKLKTDGLIIFFFILIVVVSFSLLILKFYQLQIVKAVANNNLSKLIKIPPLRGNIYLKDKDGNLFLAATSYYLYDLYFYPPKAKNIEEEIKTISQYVDILNPYIEELKKSQKSFLLAKNLTNEEKKKIENLKYDSVFFEEKVYRDYPLKDLLGTIIGFTRFNEETGLLEGQYGLEKYYDELLKGEVGYRNNLQIIKNPKKGADLVLNLDYYIQRKITEILKEAVNNFYAAGGLIIVAETKTGNILGVAELPNYDPNNFYQQKDYSIFISRLSKNYEPGSVMKPFFYAGAFQENLIKPEDTYEDKGYVVLNNWKIENFDKKGRGVIDFKTALEQSLNTGSVYISQLLGKIRFLKYIEAFRLNNKAEVDFPILEEPNFKNLKDPGKEVNFGTASFGQGIALSPLSLIQSFNAFSNQGKIIKLNFVSQIIYPDNTFKQTQPQIIARVLNQKSLETIVPILEGVVENQAKKAKILGFRIAGKTGSALIPAAKETPEKPSGYTNDVITTFIGFLTVSNPQYIVLVRLDKPAKGLLAFGTAAPTFKKVAEFLINYYNIEPDKL
ncbi:MAG: cell division protein FtsI [Candidatus Parcubacteria bacterium]|nr:MAG: cell division protein FtsI [Candidatus Parcubacteria bacterium]